MDKSDGLGRVGDLVLQKTLYNGMGGGGKINYGGKHLEHYHQGKMYL